MKKVLDTLGNLPWQVQAIIAAALLFILYIIGLVGAAVLNFITSLMMEYSGVIVSILCVGLFLFVLAIALISGFTKKKNG